MSFVATTEIISKLLQFHFSHRGAIIKSNIVATQSHFIFHIQFLFVPPIVAVTAASATSMEHCMDLSVRGFTIAARLNPAQFFVEELLHSINKTML